MYIHPRRFRALPIFTITLALTLGITNVAFAAVFRCVSGDVACLIGSMRSANERPGRHRIILEAGTYTLAVIDNTADSDQFGGNALPSVTSRLTIEGAGPTETIIQTHDAIFPQLRLFHIVATGTLTLHRLMLRGGVDAEAGGGAIFNRGTLTVSQSVIREAVSVFAFGGAIENFGTLTIVDSSIVDNFGSPGALSNRGSLRILRSAITDNNSDSCGGGIVTYFDGTTTVENSTITGNSAELSGGGLCLFSGTVTVINTTIANNLTNGDLSTGGGLVAFFGTIRLINVTVADNARSAFGFGGGGGGISVEEGATVQLQNTIVARNISEGGFDSPLVPDSGPDCLGSIISLGNNIIGDIADCSIDLAATDHVGDAGLGEFVDDETPGGGHIPLLLGSPAIDAGHRQACPRRDQLGQRRVDGDGDHRKICDIGAIEFTTDTDSDQADLLFRAVERSRGR